MKDLFTDADKQRIREAVAAAEEKTSGEIVPYIVPRSGDYEVAVWRGAVALAILALFGALLTFQFYDGWGLTWLYAGWGTALLTLLAGTVGAFCTAFIPPLKRFLAGRDRLARIVHQRAMEAFVEEEVFDTRDRTGILLFISLFEHRIEVLGDTGINESVSPDDWTEVVLCVRDGIKSDRIAEGLVEAIGMCGRLLERRGVEIRPDDTDELSNRLRIGTDE